MQGGDNMRVLIVILNVLATVGSLASIFSLILYLIDRRK